ncbi:MAG: cytochrome b [Aestuariivirga sp.]
MTKTQARYSNIAILLHWLIAALMIYMLFWGEDLIRGAKDSFAPSIHASIGISILVLSVIRLVWRLINPPPVQPGDSHGWQAKASEWVHWLFYALMIGIPLTGMADFGRQAARHPEIAGASIFGLFPVPQIPLQALGSLHGISTKLAIGLLILHVLGALKHQFWDKDRLINRMIPH